MTLRRSLWLAALVAASSYTFGQATATPDSAAAAAPAGPAAPAAPAAAPSVPSDQMLEAYGWILGQDLQVYGLGLSDDEIAAVSRGIAAAAKGQPAPKNMEQIVPALRQFVTTRPAEVEKKRVAENRIEEEKLFQEIDQRPGIKKTDTGLRYEVLAEGQGAKPGPKDTVVAHYTGTFPDGTVFDSSRDSGEPAEFELSNVIPGWQEGLRLIAPGGRIKLYVPSKLGYGDTGFHSIPPGKALLFDVELVAVKPAEGSAAPTGNQPTLPP